MKKLNINALLVVLLFAVSLMSCSKEEASPVTSSLIIANAVVGAETLMINLNDDVNPGYFYYAGAGRFKYGIFDEYVNKLSVSKPEQRIRFFKLPDTLATSAALFDLKPQFGIGSINTLFLSGTAANPDHIFVTSVPPYHNQPDSTFGIRFINLSYQSKPVSVYVISNGSQKEVDGLTYKGITEYKKYEALAKTGSYRFEFRDQGTQQVLAAYTLSGASASTENLWRYRNFTLALIGLPGASDVAQQQKTFMISNY